MEILLGIFIVLGVLAVGSLVLVNYRGGYFLNKKSILISILVFIVVVTLTSFTALPSNYVIERMAVLIIGAIGITGCVMKLFKKGNDRIIRVLISIALLGTYIGMIL